MYNFIFISNKKIGYFFNILQYYKTYITDIVYVTIEIIINPKLIIIAFFRRLFVKIKKYTKAVIKN